MASRVRGQDGVFHLAAPSQDSYAGKLRIRAFLPSSCLAKQSPGYPLTVPVRSLQRRRATSSAKADVGDFLDRLTASANACVQSRSSLSKSGRNDIAFALVHPVAGPAAGAVPANAQPGANSNQDED